MTYPRLGVLATVGLLLVTGCATLGGVSQPEPLVIGVDLALTGRGSSLDTVYHQALQLRADQINQQRETSGSQPVELRVLDSRSDPDVSAANLAELAADPQVTAVITGVCAECVINAAEDINAAGLPAISLATANEVTEPLPDRRYVFRVAPDAAGGADVMSAELRRRGVATVALITSADGYGQDGARELASATEALGIDLVVHQVLPEDADAEGMAALAAEVAAWQPEPDPLAFEPDLPELDAVVLWTPERQALGLAAALRRSGWEGPVWLDSGAAGELFPIADDEPELLTDLWLVFTETLVMDDVVASLPHLARRKEWFTAYTARYGAYHAFASFAADALDLILAATDRIGTDRSLVRDTLESVRLPGLSGPVGFSPNNHSGLDARALRVLRLIDDRWHLATS